MSQLLSGKELIKLAHEKFAEYCEDPSESQIENLFQVFNHPVSSLIFARTRQKVVEAFDVTTWKSFAKEALGFLEKSMENGDQEDEQILNANKSWRSEFESTFSASSKTDLSRSRIPQFAKYTLKIKPYDGARGTAHRWWKAARQTIYSVSPDPSPPEVNAYFNLINNSLDGYEKGGKMLNQLKPKFINEEGNLDLDGLMALFVAKHDEHALDVLFAKWTGLRQRNKESIQDYVVRFNELKEDLIEQKYVESEFNYWVKFRNTVSAAAKLREKPEIKSIEEAVKMISKMENSNIRTVTFGNGNDVVLEPSVRFMRDSIDRNLNRCSNCARPSIAHKGKSKMGSKCSFARKSLQEQLDWEKKNNYDPKLGRIRGGGNPRGRKRGSRGGQLNSVKAAQNKKLKKEARKLVATLMVEAANDGARNTQGQNRGNNNHQNPNPGSQNNGNNPNANTNNSGERIKALRKIISGNNNGNVVEDRFTGGDAANNATAAGRSGRSRKVSMAFVKASSKSDEWVETAALFDSGAMPNSYVSEKLVRELKLEDRIVGGKTVHNNATRGSKFESLGWVPMRFKLPNGYEFTADMKVADMNTELIFGEALLRRMKVIINFVTNHIHVLKAKTKLPMIAADEWSLVSRITAADFEGDAAVPKRWQKLFPKKNLREIAEELDEMSAGEDLSVERGKQLIKRMLECEYKAITVPAKRPSEKISPAPIEFKDGYQDVVVNAPPTHRSAEDWEKVEWQVAQWLKAGKVQKSNSPFNSRIVLAKKKTAPFFRTAIDYRRVNNLCKQRKFILRPTREQAEEISSKKFYSTLDEDQAYTQIRIIKKDRRKTAFSTRFGKYEFVCFPYGLMISGDVFNQKKMEIFSYEGGDLLLWRYVWTYVDDDCVGTMTVICHLFVLSSVFERFLTHMLTLKIEKCEFLTTKVKWGGHIITHGKIENDPAKGLAIKHIPTPTNLKELRRFLGMCSWHLRDFDPEYVRLSSVMTTAYRKPNDAKPFGKVWTEMKLQKVFEKIKVHAAKVLVNNTFDPECKDTHLYFDWSRQAICAVLVQHGKIVRVTGRTCSDTESRYSPTKGEAMAHNFAQNAFRNYLMALSNFFTVTDHRPLMGIDRKLDLEKLDPMFTVWREENAALDSRRKLLYVMGTKNVADMWTRLFPWKMLPAEDKVYSINDDLILDEDDFEPDDQDLNGDVKVQKVNGMKFKQDGDIMRVLIRKSWKTYVPVRTRSALVLKMHMPNHLGERQLLSKLADYYFPDKRKFVRNFLDSCRCSPMKHAGNPNKEKKADKAKLTFQDVKKPFDVVQVDTYTFDDGNGKYHYLTAIDVKSKQGFCRRICKVGAAAKHSHLYQRKLFEAYMFLESAFPNYPKKIQCDNEASLVQIPHPNVEAGPVLHPQSQSLVENFHRRLAEISRFQKVTPDEAVKFYNAGLPSGGDEEDEDLVQSIFKDVSRNSDHTNGHETYDDSVENSQGSQVNSDHTNGDEISDVADQFAGTSDHGEIYARESERMLAAIDGYKGRTLEVGDLVFQRVPKRGRMKSDDYWHRLSRVTERVGRKTYMVFDGKAVSKQSLDNLKLFSVGEMMLENLLINPEFVAKAEEAIGHVGEFDYTYSNFEKFDGDAHDGDIVWLGYPGYDQLDEVAEFLAQREYKIAFLVFPDIVCARWHEIINSLSESKWYGVAPNSKDVPPMWIDKMGRNCADPHLTWWLARFEGH